ncbi:beta-propeller fold lactonase family protein [Paenibacillus taichungensis]
MNEPKTPNLGLNKIDRSSPSTTYIDLDKYLDQNWEKVDDFAEQAEEKAEETAAQVNSIEERLDTEKRRSVTLEPGLQIINAELASPFKLEGLKGRTLVNLLGRAGGCEDLSKIGVYQSTLSLDSTNKVQGSNGLKMTIGSGTSGIGYFNVALKGGEFYVAIAEVKNGNGTSVYINLAGVGAKGNSVTDTTKFNVTWTRYTPPSDMTLNVDVGVVGTTVGQFGYADAVRLYEVSAVEYAALANMTPEQIAAKYPYVDSVQPVRNPYAIRYGENLAPPFYEWTHSAPRHSVETAPYELIMTVTDANEACVSYIELPVTPNTNYTYSAEHTGYLSVTTSLGEILVDNTTAHSVTFNAGNRQKIIINVFNNRLIGTFAFKNPMLTLGMTAKPFKPREDAMLALQTDLYANPLTGANADEVFEKHGQYFKLAKWKKRLIDGSLSYQLLVSLTGMKEVYVAGLTGANNPLAEAIMSNYNGGLLTRLEASKTAPNLFGINTVTGTLYITISAADSGWGDSYTPTTGEIKAYFMGWVMYQNESASLTPYNGTGTKGWAYRASNFSGTVNAGTMLGGTINLPTQLAPSGGTAYTWVPYQLIYQLATPTVEPITSEGRLTLIEGNNQVEVGTGLVVRENIKPVYWGNTQKFAYVNRVGASSVPDSPLKNKAKKIIRVYKDNKDDTARWTIISDTTAYGIERATYGNVDPDYDPSATYTVTYFMLDTFSATPFVGSLAETEKALLSDLNDIVQQSTSKLHFLANSIGEEVNISGSQKVSRVYGEQIKAKQSIYTETIAINDIPITDKPSGTPAFFALHPDGDLLYMGTMGSTAYKFYSIQGKTITPVTVTGFLNYSSIKKAIWTPDGKFLIVAVNSQPQVRSYSFNKETRTFVELSTVSISNTSGAVDMALTSDGTYLMLGTNGGGSTANFFSLKVQNGVVSRNLATDNAGGGIVNAVAWSPDNTYVAVGCDSSSNSLVFYKRTGDTVVKLPNLIIPHPGTPRSITFSPDGEHLIVGNNGPSSLYLYKRTGEVFTRQPDSFFRPIGRDGGVVLPGNVNFHPSGEYLSVNFSSSFSINYPSAIYKRRGDVYTEQKGVGLNTSFGAGIYAGAWSKDGDILFLAGQASSTQAAFSFKPNIVRKIGNNYIDIQSEFSEMGYAIQDGQAGDIGDVIIIWK